MKIFKNTLFILVYALIFSACPKEPGCTDKEALNYDVTAEADDGSCTFLKDKITGDWDADKLFIEGVEFISKGASVRFEFNSSGNVKLKFTVDDETEIARGSWDIDNEKLEVTWDSSNESLCIGDLESKFSIDLDGDNDLTLETRCDVDWKFVLERD